ncbi:MAG: hypothetical protein JNL01_02345 [Bdellovibrionales bacterium]|nr:hypothetical protein [Bdellovibrionales bacterium]
MGYRKQYLWRSGTALLTAAAILGTATNVLAEETTTQPVQTGEQVKSQQSAPERDASAAAADIKSKIESDSSQAQAAPVANASEATAQKPWFTRNFGMNYNSFFAGPGLTNAARGITPDFFGGDQDTGMYFWNLISVKKKNFIGDLALDIQFRNQLVVNHKVEGEAPLQFRHQGQRVGVSGKLLKGKDWVLSGAINTDLPIRAIAGQVNSERTLLLNPGMFATFSWDPAGSKWGFFALITPRVLFYRDRQAKSTQDLNWEKKEPGRNALATLKPELFLIANPSVSYTFNDKAQARLGVQLDYEKMVGGSGIQRLPMGVELGFGYDVASWLNVYTYLQTSTPLDDTLRANAGSTAKWYDTASLNVWFSGNVF